MLKRVFINKNTTVIVEKQGTYYNKEEICGTPVFIDGREFFFDFEIAEEEFDDEIIEEFPNAFAMRAWENR